MSVGTINHQRGERWQKCLKGSYELSINAFYFSAFLKNQMNFPECMGLEKLFHKFFLGHDNYFLL